MNLFTHICCILLTLFILTGCNGINNSQYYQYLTSTTEELECLTNYSYASTTQITGTAKFFKRGLNVIVQNNPSTGSPELKNLTLGNPLATALPIRNAEIVVRNSKNSIVQCGVTDSSGLLKALDGTSALLIPATSDTYNVQVLSRINLNYSNNPYSNFKLHVSVKQDKYTNTVHRIQQSLFSNGIDNLSFDLVAYARQTDSLAVEGGAFNILNSILTTYNYISTNTSGVDKVCLSTKLDAYWKIGFNPYQYLQPNSDPSYLPNNSYYNSTGDKSLNITGGRLGNSSIENTDHFDDYVIIHELAHFIEDHCGQLLSPGGSHALVSRIDPRLAWSEGWANYLAGQVMYNSISSLNPEFATKMTAVGLPTAWTYFSSTIGFSDSELNISNGTGFMFDLKKPGTNPDTWQLGSYIGSAFDKIDSTRYPGEGHFREGAISRGLFKLTNSCGTTCATSPIPFLNIWKSVDKITGAGQSTYAFKSSHDVLELVKNFTGGSWSGDNQTKSQSEALHLFSDGAYTSAGVNSWIPYGSYLTTTSGSACTIGSFKIEPRSDDPVLAGTNSDQRYSNHYYTIDLNVLSSVSEISVTFTYAAGTNTEFDLLLFKEGYFFNIDYSCSSVDSNGNCLTSWQPSRTISSDVVRSDRRSGSTLVTKKISNLQSLDHSQKYLLNIRAYTPSKTISSATSYTYVIKDQAGNYICP